MIKMSAFIALLALACVSCAGPPVNLATFDGVDMAARAVQTDLAENGQIGSSQFSILLQRLEREISALHGRTNGRQEADVLDAYTSAAEAYRYFGRFQLLERDAVKGMVLLSGSNRPVASRYGFPMESRGGGRWVDRKTAMRILSEHADVAVRHARELTGRR